MTVAAKKMPMITTTTATFAIHSIAKCFIDHGSAYILQATDVIVVHGMRFFNRINVFARTFHREHFGFWETVSQLIILSDFFSLAMSLHSVSFDASVVNECNFVSMSTNLIRKNVIFGHISLRHTSHPSAMLAVSPTPIPQPKNLLKTDFQSSAYLLWHCIVLAEINEGDVFDFLFLSSVHLLCARIQWMLSVRHSLHTKWIHEKVVAHPTNQHSSTKKK